MSNTIFGIIHDYYPLQKMISIKSKDQILFFYLSRQTQKVISLAMSHKSVFIDFEYGEKTKIFKSAPAKEITAINTIKFQTSKGLKTLFDINKEKQDLKDLINEKSYKCFLDFEFSMPGFGDFTPFTTEIIQVGLLITNEEDEVVDSYSNYVQPNTPISDRTKKFLEIDQEAFKDAISYEQFYKDYSEILDVYKPIIYVWGGNDLKTLNSSYKLHKVKPPVGRYEDLLHHHRVFYELKTDIGLFSALKIYKGLEIDQAHHALTDATATKEVFDGFKRVINGLQIVDLKNEAYSPDGE